MDPGIRDTAETEVLIIGAGLTGGVVARRLAEAGIAVLCLERGDWHPPHRFAGHGPEAERAAQKQWHPNPNIRRNPADYPIEDSGSDMHPMMFNGVGGSTILYGAQWMRFLPDDFHTFSTDGVGDDWPIGYDDLAPFYDRIDAQFSVSGIAGDPAMPPQPPYPLPVLPLSPGGARLIAAHERLGWHIWQGSNAIASRRDGNLLPCEQLAACGSGCPVGAKASTDLTHWPAVIARGGRVVTGARVQRITHDARGHADGALWRDPAGELHRVRARHVVVAANAVGTARLLLASGSSRFPQGLANGSGLVGRRLMMHPFSRAIGIFDTDLQSDQGHWGQSVYSLEFAATRPGTGFRRGAKWNLGPSGGPLFPALFPGPDGVPLTGPALADRIQRWHRRAAVWGIICEDLPEAHNRIEITPGTAATAGEPTVRMHYRMSGNSRRMLAFNLARARESLAAAGAREIHTPALLPDFGWHPLGTCRMGTDPGQSVVDPFGGAHDVPGLTIVDGSVLVTGSCANPAATLAALALRSAEHLLETR